MRNILVFDYRSIEMTFYFLCIFLELVKVETTILHLLKIVRSIHCGIVENIFLKMQNLDDSPDRPVWACPGIVVSGERSRCIESIS